MENKNKILFSNGDVITDRSHFWLENIVHHILNFKRLKPGRIFLTSDTHFGHKFVSELRGFDSVEEHDQWIVDNWNSTVKDSDIVVHLGDVTMGKTSNLGILNKCNGIKILIAGNHDKVWSRDPKDPTIRGAENYLKVFDAIVTKGSIAGNYLGEVVVLSHLPTLKEDHSGSSVRYLSERPIPGDKVCLHGHVHSDFLKKGRSYNVGIDFHPSPILLEKAVLEAKMPDFYNPEETGAALDLNADEAFTLFFENPLK